MKRTLAFAIAVLLCLPVRAQQKDGVVKSGLGVGPFPALAYDADKGRPFYRYSRYEYLFKSDFIGRLAGALSWEAGIYAS